MTRQKHVSWGSELEAELQVRVCPCVAAACSCYADIPSSLAGLGTAAPIGNGALSARTPFSLRRPQVSWEKWLPLWLGKGKHGKSLQYLVPKWQEVLEEWGRVKSTSFPYENIRLLSTQPRLLHVARLRVYLAEVLTARNAHVILVIQDIMKTSQIPLKRWILRIRNK